MGRNRFQVVLAIAAVSVLALAASAHAAIIVTPDHIVSGSATGTLVAIDVPFAPTYPLSGGPDWSGHAPADPADNGFTTRSYAIRERFGGRSPWEPDGTPYSEAWDQGTFPTGSPNVSYNFNLAASGIDVPDGATVNAVYATWTSRGGGDGATYQYTEGADSGTLPQTHTVNPTGDLVLSWTDDASTTRNANFQRLFAGPITVAGGDGFELTAIDNLGNAAHVDAVVLDVTLPGGGPPEPEPPAISINFANDQNGNASNVTGSTGVVDVPNWNNLTSDGSGDGSMANLVDSQGNSTSASAAWTSNNRWNNGSWPDDGGIGSLFRAYLDTGNGGAANGANIQIADLPAEFAGGFDVYVFFDGGGNGRFGDYTVDDGTTSITLVGNDEANNLGDFVQDLGDPASSGNYLLFEGLAGNGVTISSAATSGFRAGVNGVQIVATASAVPEPGAFALAALGLLGLAWYGGRRRLS